MSELNQKLIEAESFFAEGDFNSAADLCDNILQAEPENSGALHLKAIIAYQTGQLEKAQPFAEAAVKHAPKNPHCLNTLGLIQRNLRQFDQALITFRIALTHEPDFGQSLANMALVHIDKGDYGNAIECFEKALPLVGDNPNILTNYAHTLRDNGQTEKAAEVYRKVLTLEPDNERFLLNVGAIEMARENHDSALEAYQKVLINNPKEPTAMHIVAGLTGSTTQTAPDKYVQDLFDIYAADFDHHLASLAYQVPQMLGARIPAIMAPKAKRGAWQVLDLGCGTGACGVQVADHKAHMVGVDLSQKMLLLAEEHGVYDELLHSSIHDYLKATDRTFDLIFAADVFVYSGDLSETFALIAQRCSKGGLYCFSTELAAADEPDYLLRNTGRYAQSDSYIRRLARGHEFDVLLNKDIPLRKDVKGDTPGKLYILQKR